MFLISALCKSYHSALPNRPGRWLFEVVAVFLASGLAAAVWPLERVTWENFDRIRIGMGKPEVRRIFVRRPDESFARTGRVASPTRMDWDAIPAPIKTSPRQGFLAYRVESWEGPGLSIAVVFDAQDRVACRLTGPSHGRKRWTESLPQPARVWLARIF